MKKKKNSGDILNELSKNELYTLPDEVQSGAETGELELDEFDMVFSGADATDTAPEKRRGFSLKSIFNLKNFMLLICIVTFAVCAVILFGRWFDYQRTDDLYLALSEDMFKEVSNDPSVLSTSPTFSPQPTVNQYNAVLNSGASLGEVAPSVEINIEHARVKAKLEEIKRVNDDIIGWIRVVGTEINYPIVLGYDNDYYLTHAYNGEYLRSGTIFADYRNYPKLTDNYNTVLYGHNMANGSMFAAVKKFLKEDFFNSKVVEIYTFDGMYVFEPFAMLNTDTSVYYNRMYFESNDQYENFLQDMYNRSMFKKDITLSASDRIITLSTCNNSRVTGRYALLAKLTKVE